MMRSSIHPQSAIWGSFVFVLLVAILVIAYDLQFMQHIVSEIKQLPLNELQSTQITDALLDTAEQQVNRERHLDAWNTLLNAEDVYRKHNRLELLARVHWMRARMLHELKEFDAANEEIDRSATLAERLGSEEYKAETAYLLATNLYGRREYELVYQLIENRLQDSRAISLKNAIHFHNLAGLSRGKAGDLYEAEIHFLSALDISKHLNQEQYGFLYGNLGHVYAQQGRLNDAKKYLALDFEWSKNNHQFGSASSAAYLLAELLSASNSRRDQIKALLYLNQADSLALLQNAVQISMPSDSLWWRIQLLGTHSSDAHTDLAIIAKRAALNKKRAEEAQSTVKRNRIYEDGRAQWQKHIADRDRSVQRSGQALSFAAGIFLLMAIVLIKPE